MKLFLLRQMAKIVGLSEAQSKNWTNGRLALRITPSGYQGTGRGSQNLYTVHDLYLTGIAHELYQQGFRLDAIMVMLETLRPQLSNFTYDRKILLTNTGFVRATLDVGGVIQKIDATLAVTLPKPPKETK